MDEDAFDRAVQRERELRARLEGGDIDEDELNVLRDFDDADITLTLPQARRLVDEGVDPAAVAELVRRFPRVGLDAAIDLTVDHGLEAAGIVDLVEAGLPPNLGVRELGTLFDDEISPELIQLVVRAGFADEPVKAILELTQRVCDPADTLAALEDAQLTGLTLDQIATIADYEVNPKVVRRLLDGDPELDIEEALRLVLGDDAPSAPHARNVGLVVGLDVAIGAARVGAQIARGVARAFTAR